MSLEISQEISINEHLLRKPLEGTSTSQIFVSTNFHNGRPPDDKYIIYQDSSKKKFGVTKIKKWQKQILKNYFVTLISILTKKYY